MPTLDDEITAKIADLAKIYRTALEGNATDLARSAQSAITQYAEGRAALVKADILARFAQSPEA